MFVKIKPIHVAKLIMQKIAIIIDDHTALFELGCAVELFGLKRPEINNWYKTEVVTFNNNAIHATAGIGLKVKKVRSLNKYDSIIIPSWPVTSKAIEKNIAEAICTAHHKGKRLISFCSGAFLLAELGLLDGRQATTHWRYAASFKEKYPKINYVDDVLYVNENNIACSAGSAAALDLGIELIRTDFNHQVANQVAKRLVLSAHRAGGQTQFAETPVLELPNQFGKSLDWARSHLAYNIDINTLASKARMSRRTFDRKFRASLNITPKQWLTQQRIDRAKNLLESKNLSIEQIAVKSGFDNSITMRHHFRKALGVSPAQYKQQFIRH